MSLAGKYCRQPVAQNAFHYLQNAQLVVHHDVMFSWVVLRDGIEHLLLVNIDQHPALDRVPETRTLHLAWLEHHVAIGQDDRLTELAQMPDDVEHCRIEALLEWIVHQKR